jgi:hypothetical protein
VSLFKVTGKKDIRDEKAVRRAKETNKALLSRTVSYEEEKCGIVRITEQWRVSCTEVAGIMGLQ